MLRPARAAMSLALVVLLAAPAAAQEQPDEEPRAAVPLRELIGRGESELRLLAAPGRLAPRDMSALREYRLARLDLAIGSIRDEAMWTIQSALPAEAVSVLLGFGSDVDSAAVTAASEAAGLDAVTEWRVDSIAPDWLELQSVVARLRSLAQTGPERVCPVPGDAWFEDNWGDDRPWGRAHKGIDLHAEFASALVAVEDGVVVQANWHRSGGRQIYIRADSTGDVYYYAHLEYWEKWIWTGTRVTAGVEIGLLGDSGNADSPHLHFGWMPGSSDVDLDNLQDPYPLLLEVCGPG